MIKQLCKVVMLSTVLLTIFDGGGVDSVYAANQSVYRGNFTVIEVDEDSPMTAIPDTGTWYNGELDTSPQQYDVLVSARGDVSGSTDQKLDLVVTSYKTPDFFELNSQRKLLVAESKPMGTLSLPRGHDCRWVTIELKTVSGKVTMALSDMEKHICLGLRIQGDSQYLDILRSEHLSTLIDLSDTENLELVPLLSKSASEYKAIEPGTEYPPSDSDYKPSGQFNFGSVFRISATINSSSWVYPDTDLPDGGWLNDGHLGVGPITTQSRKKYDDQLLAVKTDGTLARSSDGIHWFLDMGKVSDEVTAGWNIGLVCSDNGIWCVVNSRDNRDYPARYSADGGKTWNDSDLTSACRCLAFDHGTFMAITYREGYVYTSTNGVNWTQIGEVASHITNLIYGKDKWICFTDEPENTVYYSSDGQGKWGNYTSNGLGLGATLCFGGCYVNGYFYIMVDAVVCRSADGENWELGRGGGNLSNVAHYKNKLYSLTGDGGKCLIGTFNPDGTIDLK